jgi:hypothetical protein
MPKFKFIHIGLEVQEVIFSKRFTLILQSF